MTESQSLQRRVNVISKRPLRERRHTVPGDNCIALTPQTQVPDPPRSPPYVSHLFFSLFFLSFLSNSRTTLRSDVKSKVHGHQACTELCECDHRFSYDCLTLELLTVLQKTQIFSFSFVLFLICLNFLVRAYLFLISPRLLFSNYVTVSSSAGCFFLFAAFRTIV